MITIAFIISKNTQWKPRMACFQKEPCKAILFPTMGIFAEKHQGVIVFRSPSQKKKSSALKHKDRLLVILKKAKMEPDYSPGHKEPILSTKIHSLLF